MIHIFTVYFIYDCLDTQTHRLRKCQPPLSPGYPCLTTAMTILGHITPLDEPYPNHHGLTTNIRVVSRSRDLHRAGSNVGYASSSSHPDYSDVGYASSSSHQDYSDSRPASPMFDDYDDRGVFTDYDLGAKSAMDSTASIFVELYILYVLCL